MAASARSGAGIETPARRMVWATSRQRPRSLAPAASSTFRTSSAEGRGAAGAVTEVSFGRPDAVAVEPSGTALF